MRLINADALMDTIIHRSYFVADYWNTRDAGMFLCGIEQAVNEQPTVDAVPVVRCKDCVHQTKFWHNDGRMKNRGYYICGCDLVDGYSHVCLDDDFCSRGERRDGEQDDGKGND